MRSWLATLGADTHPVDQTRRGGSDESVELSVSVDDLVTQVLTPLGQAAQRGLDTLGGIGEVTGGTEPCALAISFDLLDPEQRQRTGARLASLVAEHQYQVSTGFAGTPFVTWGLSETGHLATAYRLLQERSCPSWLYPVTMGATTIWERWDSLLPDGEVNPSGMTSFNHYALGAVAECTK